MTIIINHPHDNSMLTPLPKIYAGDKPTFIMASGPSMADIDPTPFAGKQHIAVNQTWQKFPQAQVQFSIDSTWWNKHAGEFRQAHPHKFAAYCTLHPEKESVSAKYNVALYRQSRADAKQSPAIDFGFDTRPGHLRGNNSGGTAINLAWHLGARLIILVGFDMRLHPEPTGRFDSNGKPLMRKKIHWYQDDIRIVNPTEMTFTNVFIPALNSMFEPARAAGCTIINCTQGSALKIFRMDKLENYL